MSTYCPYSDYSFGKYAVRKKKKKKSLLAHLLEIQGKDLLLRHYCIQDFKYCHQEHS